MSQSDILNLLEKKKKKVFTSKEISEILKVRQENILRSIAKLLEYDEIKSRKITSEELKDKGYDSKQLPTRFWVYWVE
jgi:transcription initiation factor IIE alpha subunit